MIRFATLGTNDLLKSSNFYDEILKIIDIFRIEEEEGRYVGYAKQKERRALVVKLVDTKDLKSLPFWECQFESGRGHHFEND